MKNRIFFLSIITALFFLNGYGQSKEIIGYFPSWKWKHSDALMSHEKVSFSKVTMLNYAFWYPLPSGEITGRDAQGDSIALFHKNRKPSIIELAHQHKVRVLLSLGGWEDSGNFPAVSSSDSTRKKFAQSCADCIRTLGFDGIDIDWEFPGMAEHNGTANDKRNYTLLLQTLRDTLRALEQTVQKKILLTAAFPAGAGLLNNFEIDSLLPLLDMVNIMTYDFYGSWSPISGHNSALYASSALDTVNTIDATVRYYRETLHVPSQKINIGVPFYGQSFSQCAGLYKAQSGMDTALFSPSGAFYYNIVHVLTKQNRRWDSNAKVPYIILPEKNTLISFDDQESVAEKARYVLHHHLRGVIIWEITGDYLSDGSTPLLDALNRNLSRNNSLH
ncbi:MAG: hypothetical protein H3C35_00280 [Bacteroidetes bacterium]|nr:hypothetical protein [Bacteroidota bacterium]